MNSRSVLYIYELDADQCAIVISIMHGEERVVAVDGGLDEVTEKLAAAQDDDAGRLSIDPSYSARVET